ncbi:MAG: hypothetical protein HYW92_00750 [Nitrosarchaeum sp.]|nr:hypothetical protein [Nitrosarchaeum sp.]
MKYLAILSLLLLFGTAYAATPFFADGGLTQNGIEWCEENYQLYQLIGDDFFEHHHHSIESRTCANLYLDPLWTYNGTDRYEKLVEQSKVYTQLEIEESKKEAETGIIDTKPVSAQEIPQEIIQQQKELEDKLNEKSENYTLDEIQEFGNYTITDDVNSNNKGGCLIATAAFGSELAPQVQFLREIRDNKVMSTTIGASFMTGFNQLYYSFSPTIADMERKNPVFKEIVKIGITPMISSLSIMSAAESEQEILGYGIGVILLNIVMYFVAPAMLIYKIKKYT